MPSTYSGDPSTTPTDAVRFLARDTGSTFYTTDEEIEWVLAEEGNNVYMAASKIAYQVGTQFVRAEGGSKSVGDLSISGGESKARDYFNLAKSLERRAMRSAFVPTPYAGGIDLADKEANRDDSSLADHSFRRGVHDHPGGAAAGMSDAITDTSREQN